MPNGNIKKRSMLSLILSLCLVHFAEAAVSFSSGTASSGNINFQITSDETSGSVSTSISSFTVDGNAYELTTSSAITADLTISELSKTYTMTFEDPVDKIEEKVHAWNVAITYGHYQTISSDYAQTLINELRDDPGGWGSYGSHKGSGAGDGRCNFGDAGSTGLHGHDLNGDDVVFTSTQKEYEYAWTTSDIESNYHWWSRYINPDAASCAMSGYLIWGDESESLWQDRKRWALLYKPDESNFFKCPGTEYPRSISADLTGIQVDTCDLNTQSGSPMCDCGNCVNGDYDGSGYCVQYQYYTGWKETSGTFGMYDDSDNLQSWSSYTAASVASTSGSASTLDINIGSNGATSFELDIDGSFSTSTSYDTTVTTYFAATSGNRLVIPDIGIKGSYPLANEFVVIPDNLFASDHGCGSVLVDSYEWFKGTHSTIVLAGDVYNSAQCSDSVGTLNFCTDNHAECLNNTLTNWMNWGQIDRNDIAFPGFDMLNIGGSYTSDITVETTVAPGSRAKYSEDDIKLKLDFNYDNTAGYSLSLAQSDLTFKEPLVDTTITYLDNTNFKTTGTHFEVDLQITNAGDVGGDFCN